MGGEEVTQLFGIRLHDVDVITAVPAEEGPSMRTVHCLLSVFTECYGALSKQG